MAANSALRRIVKRLLLPFTNDKIYQYLQAASKAYDIRSGNWSEPEIDLVSIGLRRGETALDIGANYGLYAYHMSRAVGPTGKVYSFEPIPFTYRTLCIVGRFLGLTGNTEFVHMGCSNENGKVTFKLPLMRSGAITAGQAYIGKRNDNREGSAVQVRWDSTTDVEAEVVRLDDFLSEIVDLPLVKIDIEGAELYCLNGGAELFSKHLPTIICEIAPWLLEGFGVSLEQLLAFFLDRGYKMYFYSNEGGSGRLREVALQDIVEDNYVFLHPSRMDRYSSLLQKAC